MKTQLNIKNPLEVFLGKPSKDFRRADLMLYMEENNIHMLNFRYPGEDGKLKTLNFAIENKAHLENVLTYGERVDGSSIFTYIDNGSSDLYVIPMYRTAFLDPFAETRKSKAAQNRTGMPTEEKVYNWYRSESPTVPA